MVPAPKAFREEHLWAITEINITSRFKLDINFYWHAALDMWITTNGITGKRLHSVATTPFFKKQLMVFLTEKRQKSLSQRTSRIMKSWRAAIRSSVKYLVLDVITTFFWMERVCESKDLITLLFPKQSILKWSPLTSLFNTKPKRGALNDQTLVLGIFNNTVCPVSSFQSSNPYVTLHKV